MGWKPSQLHYKTRIIMVTLSSLAAPAVVIRVISGTFRENWYHDGSLLSVSVTGWMHFLRQAYGGYSQLLIYHELKIKVFMNDASDVMIYYSTGNSSVWRGFDVKEPPAFIIFTAITIIVALTNVSSAMSINGNIIFIFSNSEWSKSFQNLIRNVLNSFDEFATIFLAHLWICT